MNNLKAMNCHIEYEDVERKVVPSFAIVMFADLRWHLFRSKFVPLSCW